MTYADMITLLLCFFAVFLFASFSLTQKKEEPLPVEKVSEVKRAVVGQESLPPDIAPPPEVQVPPPPRVIIGNLPFHDPSIPIEEETVEAAQPIQPTTNVPVPPVLSEQPDKTGNKTGDKITVMEMNSSTFFESGSAQLSEPGEAVLKDLLEKIRSDIYKDYQITVEGHTDDTPIKTVQFPSNWELSTARAAAVVHYFLDQGIVPQRLRAAGYADSFPKLPNHDASGKAIPENQAQNRRVIIKLEKIEKSAD